MATHKLEPEIYYYTYGPFKPLARMHDGDSVVAETRDALGYDANRNTLPESSKQRLPGTSLKESNPAIGPLFVEEAEEGDMLAVKIDRIRLNRDFAISKQGANFGSLTGEGPGRLLLYNEPIETIFYEWRLDLERNVGIFEMPQSRMKRVEVTLDPFI